jgi:hypothetical protein
MFSPFADEAFTKGQQRQFKGILAFSLFIREVLWHGITPLKFICLEKPYSSPFSYRQ